jgi:hypothetical protein
LGSFNVTAARGYVDTPEQALARIREALESDCLYDYTLPPDAEALVSLELIMKHHAHKS